MNSKLLNVKTEAQLQTYLLEQINGLYKALAERHISNAALLLCDWVSATTNYVGSELQLDWKETPDLIALLHQLARYEGGLWCAGTARLLVSILALFNIPACTYGYGYKGNLSHLAHTTTLFLADEVYNVDAYLNYWWASEPGKMMPFPHVLNHIARQEHASVIRMDRCISRALITPASSNPTAQREWLFDDPPPASQTLTNGNMITPGAVHSLDKLFLPHTPMWLLAQEVIGDRDLPTFLLDMMLVNPRIGSFNTAQGPTLDRLLKEGRLL